MSKPIPANDTRGPSTRGAGRDVWKAIGTIRRGVEAGTPAGMKSARAAAAYAWPRLGVAVPVPTTDAKDVWELVLRVLEATAEGLDRETRELRAALAR